MRGLALVIIGFVGTAAVLLTLQSLLFKYYGPANLLPPVSQKLILEYNKPPPQGHQHKRAHCYYILRMTHRCTEPRQ